MKKRAHKLTVDERSAINLALRCHYEKCMEEIDMHNTSSTPRHFLVWAGEAWDAYRALNGYPMHDAVVRS